MTSYRILHQETDDSERWRLSEEAVVASSAQGAVRAFVRDNPSLGGSTTYCAVPVRSWREREAQVETQLRLVVT